MKVVWLLLLALAGCSKTVTYERTTGRVPILVFGGSIQDTLTGTNVTPIAPLLEKSGYSVVTMDLPCHGKDAEWLHPHDGLGCWKRRIEAGDREIFSRFADQVSKTIDELGVSSIAVVGISRGGYVALVCAAHDARITRLVLIAPVTDLWKLTEFQSLPRDESFTAPLVNRSMLVRIGKNDDRVGTIEAVEFAHKANATLQLLDTKGHLAPEDGSSLAWLMANERP